MDEDKWEVWLAEFRVLASEILGLRVFDLDSFKIDF